jgi:hypothetical protein
VPVVLVVWVVQYQTPFHMLHWLLLAFIARGPGPMVVPETRWLQVPHPMSHYRVAMVARVVVGPMSRPFRRVVRLQPNRFIRLYQQQHPKHSLVLMVIRFGNRFIALAGPVVPVAMILRVEMVARVA